MPSWGPSSLGQSTLVLNRSWTVVNVTSVRRAFCLIFSGKARVISPETFEILDFHSWTEGSGRNGHPIIRTVNLKIRIPEVILLKTYDSLPSKEVPFSRRNLYRRDNFTCQYCGKRFRIEELTIDHIFPKSKGGATDWDNCVLACFSCNFKKGDLSLEKSGLRLRKTPVRPRWNPTSPRVQGSMPQAWESFISRKS